MTWAWIAVVFSLFLFQVGCGQISVPPSPVPQKPVPPTPVPPTPVPPTPVPPTPVPPTPVPPPPVPPTPVPPTSVLTYHNDPQRTGQNLSETILTTSNVTSAKFGKVFSFPTDGDIYAQPLYVPSISIPGKGKHNVVFVATEHDSVYAFDADGTVTAPLWQRSFLDPAHGTTSVPQSDLAACRISPELGITGTPVIDHHTLTMYLVAFTKENGGYVQRLHALDITTGIDKIGPVEIVASVNGTGAGRDGMGHIAFQPRIQLQRSALLLAGGVVYIAWASMGGDMGPYHGWVMGYDATTLHRVAVWNSTRNGGGGGIWQDGSGLAQDNAGNLWLMTGNGTFDVNIGGSDYGGSIVKLVFTNPGLKAVDYFAPFNQLTLSNSDQDLGSGGIMLLLLQNASIPRLALGAGKGGTIYLVNRDHPGRFNPANDSQIVQSIPNGAGTHPSNNNFCTPAYWHENVYFIAEEDVIRQYPIDGGRLKTPPMMGTHAYNGSHGATPAVSADGNTNGIVWAVERSPSAPEGTGTLHAYDGLDVARELYNSNQAGTRDQFGVVAVFVVPTIANGRVYVGATHKLVVFGLL